MLLNCCTLYVSKCEKLSSGQRTGKGQFSSSHVRVGSHTRLSTEELIVVLEKNHESPLDSKEIKPVNSKGNQSWIYIRRTDAEAEAPILWPPDRKSRLIGKDLDAGKDWGQVKGVIEDEMAGWHHWLNGHEFEQTQGDREGQGSLVSGSPWSCKESQTT